MVRRALRMPVRKIAETAGVHGSIASRESQRPESASQGYDVQRERYVDMFKAGLIDPTKVVRTALRDVASIAGLLVTTEAMLAEKPEKKEATPMPGARMGGMEGMM